MSWRLPRPSLAFGTQQYGLVRQALGSGRTSRRSRLSPRARCSSVGMVATSPSRASSGPSRSTRGRIGSHRRPSVRQFQRLPGQGFGGPDRPCWSCGELCNPRCSQPRLTGVIRVCFGCILACFDTLGTLWPGSFTLDAVTERAGSRNFVAAGATIVRFE
jgi:hypothetical protein